MTPRLNLILSNALDSYNKNDSLLLAFRKQSIRISGGALNSFIVVRLNGGPEERLPAQLLEQFLFQYLSNHPYNWQIRETANNP